ncbi:hypothetical protein E1B28_000808 [Marasmius oreades]|uniref:Uncharacterized protein n=1 Tax=Marasmius oreades TaxID=181124 RepID=A0A9P8AEV9_9AGAR|nr:uncharacterized protein E1B28_000808 [Marasmius oreades]KAG7098908.1 hypothetical protein E1B28_000808 [Marasmius oreades]
MDSSQVLRRQHHLPWSATLETKPLVFHSTKNKKSSMGLVIKSRGSLVAKKGKQSNHSQPSAYRFHLRSWDELEAYRVAGSYWIRCIDLFNSVIPNVILYGIDNDNVQKYGGEREPTFNPIYKDKTLRIEYRVAYNKFKATQPGIFKRILQCTEYEDDSTLTILTHVMMEAMRGVRKNDSCTLKGLIFDLILNNPNIPEDDSMFSPPIKNKNTKNLHGFNHIMFAHYMVPYDNIADFKNDLEGTWCMLQSSDVESTGDQLLSFLYDNRLMKPDKPAICDGLFWGEVLRQCTRAILCSPSAAIDKAESSTRRGNGKILDIQAMDPELLGYMAVQTYFALSEMPEWTTTNGEFDLQLFYQKVVDNVTKGSSNWKLNLWRYFDKGVFVEIKSGRKNYTSNANSESGRLQAEFAREDDMLELSGDEGDKGDGGEGGEQGGGTGEVGV